MFMPLLSYPIRKLSGNFGLASPVSMLDGSKALKNPPRSRDSNGIALGFEYIAQALILPK
jgi:hypothetical protein